MKKRFTRGEKWLFASPLLFLSLVGAVWFWQKSRSVGFELPPIKVSSLEFSPDSQRLAVIFESRRTIPSPPDALTARTLGAAGWIYDVESRTKIRDLQLSPLLARKRMAYPSYFPPVWSPDGKVIAAISQETGLNKIALWDTESGAMKGEYSIPYVLSSVSGEYDGDSPLVFAPDSKTVSTQNQAFHVLDVATGKFTPKARDSKSNRSIRPNVDRNSRSLFNETGLGLVAVADNEQNGGYTRIRVLDSKTKRVVWEPETHNFHNHGWYGDILCVTDGVVFGYGGLKTASRLLLWNGKTRHLLPSPPIPSGAEIGTFAFNPDGQSIAYFDSRVAGQQVNKWGEMVVWNYRQNRVVGRSEVNVAVYQPRWTADGKWLTALSYFVPKDKVENQHRIFAFDNTGKLRFDHETNTEAYSWSPDGKQLAFLVMGTNSFGRSTSLNIEVQRF